MDDLEAILLIMAEHRTIGRSVRQVDQSLNEMDALLGIEQAKDELITDVRTTFSEKLERLKRSVITLEEGLSNHYQLEEQELPQLLGRLPMDALIADHRRLRDEFLELKQRILSIESRRMTRNDKIAEEAVLYQMVSRMSKKLEEHKNREEAILLLLKDYLEEKAKVHPI